MGGPHPLRADGSATAFARALLHATLAVILFIAFIGSADPVAVVSARGAGDEVHVITATSNTHYKVTCRYVCDGSRMILIGVIEQDGTGHRVSRRRVKAGNGSFTWTAKKSKYSRLVRVCAAMHTTDNDQNTTASDCSYF